MPRKPTPRQEKIAKVLKVDVVTIELVDFNHPTLLDNEYYALPEHVMVTINQLTAFRYMGLRAISSYDGADVPGDQHPQILLQFKKAKESPTGNANRQRPPMRRTAKKRP